ncbi:MAG: DUF1015 domain-containing protein [Kiritimatiellae bacterium]|nr:DUF1015 domain-containing protein [Kiritimatiellia bacterium]
MKIRPFSALRPADNALAARIASLPYDVVDTAEARALAGDPLSFYHVVRSEIDLEEGTPIDAPEVYAGAAKALKALESGGSMVREAAPALYLYRQVRLGAAQTAVVACCSIDDYASGVILKHEKTRKDKEDDRTRHILETRAHTGQVFLCYRDNAGIDGMVERECGREPMFDFTAEDGVRHVVWRVEGDRAAALAQAFSAVPRAYIADGHHRSAASFRSGSELRAAADPSTLRPASFADDPGADWFMACLFPASQLNILPYNRCVRDLNGLSNGDFLKAALARGFSAASIATPENLPAHSCAMRLSDGWYRLSWPVSAEQASDPVARLDVARLQEDLLAPVLGIGDPRTDPRIYFVGGIRGVSALEGDVDRGKAAVAFAMHPTAIDQMMAVADAGAMMPPKSTWFEPKLRSGLLVHSF